MSDEPLLPHRLTLLGEAMRPVWKNIEREINHPIQPSRLVNGMKELIPSHLDALVTAVQRLEKRVNQTMPDIITNEDATDAAIYRSVGGFEALMDDVLAEYQEIRSLDVRGSDREARDLLAGIYCHTLGEVCDWLQELVETLADPMATVIRRGLPTSGNVTLTLALTLTAAPQLPAMAQWAKRHAVLLTTPLAPARYQPPQRSSGLGFFGMVAAVALGWGIGEALFGDDDCNI